MSIESHPPKYSGLLLAAITIISASVAGICVLSPATAGQGNVQGTDSTRRPGTAPHIPYAVTDSSSLQQAVLAHIDSLWEAGAGLACHDEILQHVASARASGDSLFLLNLLCREGRVLSAHNRPLDAEPLLREGMQLAEGLNEPLLYRACLRWLGFALIGRGRLEDASACYELLLRLSQQSGDKYHEGYAWMGLAYHDWKSGKAADAREKYTRSAGIFRELGNVRGELWALIGLNNVLSTLCGFKEAIAGNRRIVAMGRESGSPVIEALGYNNLGVQLFYLGDNGEALLCFQRAAELQEQNGYIREAIIAGQNVCICEIALGRTRDASRRLLDLLKTSREHGYADVEVGLLKELAFAHMQQGSLHLAARMFREALSLTDGLTPKNECEAVIGLSEAMAGMDSTLAALELLRSKADRMLALEDSRLKLAFRNETAERMLDENLPAEAFEMAMVVENRGVELGLTRYRLEALTLAARASLELGRPDSAMVLLRRGVRLWETDRGVPLDPEWREQRGTAARDLFTQLTRLILRHPPGHPHEQRVREAFDVLQAYKARTLLERMLGPGGREVPVLHAPPVTLAEIQTGVLLPDELLLDYLIGRDSSLVFACTTRESRALVLPGESKLNRKLHLLHELLAARPRGQQSPADPGSIAQAARNMAEIFSPHVADLIAGSRHVIVVPDGALNLLPFSTLFHMNGMDPIREEADRRPVSASDGGPTVCRIPAATVLARLRKGKGKEALPPYGNILALAGLYTDRGEMLHGAKEEIAILERRYAGVTTKIQRTSGVRESTGTDSIDAKEGSRQENGLPETFQVEGGLPADAFAGFDILHFAAHSTVDDQSPWRSSIQLGTGTERTVLRASEIAGWRLPARLAVLSSCESARGRILSGEGVQGLTSAFLSAGVPSVLATLWTVDDEVTVDFMAAFYDALQEGECVSAALRRAQSTIRRRSASAHPFYWAGFVLTGEGKLHVNLRERPRTHTTLWVASISALVIILLALAAGRKKYYKRQ